MTLPHYLRMAHIAGLDAKTALLFKPGVVFDMFELSVPKEKEKEID